MTYFLKVEYNIYTYKIFATSEILLMKGFKSQNNPKYFLKFENKVIKRIAHIIISFPQDQAKIRILKLKELIFKKIENESDENDLVKNFKIGTSKAIEMALSLLK